MEGRRRIASGSPYERMIGFSRAVVVGDTIHVSGTAPVMADGADPPPDAYGQAKRCLEIIVEALRGGGAGPEHVVRTRTFLTRREDWEAVGRAHGEAFAAGMSAGAVALHYVMWPWERRAGLPWLTEAEGLRAGHLPAYNAILWTWGGAAVVALARETPGRWLPVAVAGYAAALAFRPSA